MDYERSITRLTPEQRAAVDLIKLNGDFLVKGNAGTGKTLVLLEALRKAREQSRMELELTTNELVLLTYTRTLAKYNRYIAAILDPQEVQNVISTADSYFLKILREARPGASVRYDLMNTLCRELNTTGFLSDRQLAVEIEDFIFANGITEAEYIDERIARKGLRTPLNNAQRTLVWEIRNRCIERMEQENRFSRNYSRAVILSRLEEHDDRQSGLHADFIFVDETQDLNSVELKILKRLARRAVIMAGDLDQSIYGIVSPYIRSGLHVQGRTRQLVTNFRNTHPIHELAQMYRLSERAAAEQDLSSAFREGPVPELYASQDDEELLELLGRKTDLFLRKLKFDPENVGILVPSNGDVSAVERALSGHGYEVVNIKKDGFGFEDTGKVRVSTIHSSKGLDFPVVLLYLPRAPRTSEYDEQASETLRRSLIYVGMTRAMDNLSVFVRSDAGDPALRGLVRVYGAYVEGCGCAGCG